MSLDSSAKQIQWLKNLKYCHLLNLTNTFKVPVAPPHISLKWKFGRNMGATGQTS
jgi:hypothetical protein